MQFYTPFLTLYGSEKIVMGMGYALYVTYLPVASSMGQSVIGWTLTWLADANQSCTLLTCHYR